MTGSDPSDEELMQRVQAGDDASFRALFARHQRAVYGFLLRRTGRAETAAELFQETWLRVHRGRAGYRPDQRFRPWLFGIAANAGRDQRRQQLRVGEEVELAELPARRARPEATLTLDAAITALPEPLREVFLLGAVYGFDHNEVAEQLGIRPDNARARLSRARAALRALVGDTWPGEGA